LELYQIDIPRGSYTSQFSPRIIEELATAPAASTAVPSEEPQDASARSLESSREASPWLAASDFITSEDSLEKLKNWLHLDALKHFEILLKTTKLDNTPLSAEIIAARNIE
jgi:hypothetical protein